MDRPRQAVILAGGLGSRLGEIARRVPKPLVPAGGAPFLAYLLRMLACQGFERVLLLLGYKADMIRDWAGDGRFGLSIDYSLGAIDDGTGRRVVRAAPLLDPTFLLLYCDNYWPLSIDRMWNAFEAKAGAVAQMTVYRNRQRHKRSNVIVDDDGFVRVYDKSRTRADLEGLDIGFVLARREVVDVLSARDDSSFEAEAYTALAERGALAAYETDHRYYSIGNPADLAEAEAFLTRKPCVLIERDGVLNAAAPDGCPPTTPDDWRWLPGAPEGLRQLRDAGVDVIVVASRARGNREQPGDGELKEIHACMSDETAVAGGRILDVLHCAHPHDSPCDCRAPRSGLLLRAQRRHQLDLSMTPFVGSGDADRRAAWEADQPFFGVDPARGLAQAVPGLLDFLRRHGQGRKPTG